MTHEYDIVKNAVLKLSHSTDVGNLVGILARNQYNVKVEYNSHDSLYPYHVTINKIEVEKD